MRQSALKIGILNLAALGFGIVLIANQPAWAKERTRQDLTALADADASGEVRLMLRSDSRGSLELRVRSLDPSSTFEVIVGGVKVGTLTTSRRGAGRARFSTRPRGREQLLGFDPHGTDLVLRDAAGEDVLGGTLQAGLQADAGLVTCCVPDDSGSECEARTATACAERGGTVSTANSCLPNPCSNALPETSDVVCCVADDSGNTCEDRSATDCAAQNGVVVLATSCESNPCDGVPATNPKIRCCLPDDSGLECEDRTEAQCTAQAGVSVGPGACTPDACAAVASPTPTAGDDHGGGNGNHGGGTAGTTTDNHGGRTTYY